jgi:DNA-binding response OmpR family regulator
MRQEEKAERFEAQRRAKILVVEDEPAMVAGLRDNFEFEGYEVITAQDGIEGLQRALDESPDLVVLDVMMPRMSGLEVCKQLRTKRASLPIIMLTARGQEIDKVVGLELGADDYVTKPFSIRELLARVKSVLRRTAVLPKDKEQHSFADVEVDLRRCRVVRSGKALDISSKEFELLKYFICHPGETLSRDRLSHHPDGGYPPGAASPKAGARSGTTTVLFDRARNRIPVRRIEQPTNS